MCVRGWEKVFKNLGVVFDVFYCFMLLGRVVFFKVVCVIFIGRVIFLVYYILRDF